MQESELKRFRNTWDELNDVIDKLPTLKEYVDVDRDCAERLSDEDIFLKNIASHPCFFVSFVSN